MIAILGLLAAIGGAAIGSFLHVVRLRGWHGAMEGRSKCDTCDRTLEWHELVPVFSFAMLGGRCRTCRSAIPVSAFGYELGGALVAVLLVAII